MTTIYLPSTIQCPEWCNDHSGLDGIADEDGGWHCAKPLTVGPLARFHHDQAAIATLCSTSSLRARSWPQG